MENNKSQFKRTGVLHDGAECIEIQISHSGDAARCVSTIKFTVKDPEVTRGRWQEIRYSKKITETREIPGKAMLVEVITVDENGINIR